MPGEVILLFAASTREVFSVNPVSGQWEELSWASEMPDWQRVAPD